MFIRFGTPSKINVVHTCDICKQPGTLSRVSVKGVQRSVCPACAAKIKNVKPS